MVLVNDCSVVDIYVYCIAVLPRLFGLLSVIVADARGRPCIVPLLVVLSFWISFLMFLSSSHSFLNSLSFCGSCLVVGV